MVFEATEGAGVVMGVVLGWFAKVESKAEQTDRATCWLPRSNSAATCSPRMHITLCHDYLSLIDVYNEPRKPYFAYIPASLQH